MAAPPAIPPEKSNKNEPLRSWLNFPTISTLVGLAIAVGASFAGQGSPVAIAIVCGIVAITAVCINVGCRSATRLLLVVTVVGIIVSVASATIAVERALAVASSSASTSPAVANRAMSASITNPDPATPGNPPSSVSCRESVDIAADVPSNYVVVVANKARNGPSWYFQEADKSSNKNWNTVVYFFQGRTGSYYQIIALAIPREWADYVNSVFGSVQTKSGGGWDFSSFPPSSTVTSAETVQLSAPGHTC